MGLILQIILISALIGAALNYFFGNRTQKGLTDGAAVGILMSLYVLIKLIFYGFMAALGLFLIARLFG
jgi:hypothetical protein